MNEAQNVIDLLKRERFFDLTGTDGCICAEIKLCRIYIDVHCYKSEYEKCKCEGAGIHITPLEPQDNEKLKEIGSIFYQSLIKWNYRLKS